MSKFNLRGPVDAVQYEENVTEHPSIGNEGDDDSFAVLYHYGNAGECDVLFDGDWIVTTVDGKNFAVDVDLFNELFVEVK